ncbi:MAG: sulfatase-like hydrolase/transferase [Oligoflexia bacterium]|nr:sulfatase-like hydrolase/transferase [Oligoflexia bacterium]
MAARPTVLPRLGPIQRRFSYATWTAPAHYNLLMGLLPHPAPKQVFASTWYTKDFALLGERLNVPGLNFSGMLPGLWLPDHLRNRLGYRTGALVSMPVLNPHTPLNHAFDIYRMAPTHNDLAAMIDQMDFLDDRPSFWLLNTGETHYPYAQPDEPEQDWPTIHGVHGVFARVAAGQPLNQADAPRFFDQGRLDALRNRQIAAAAYLDGVIGRLLDVVPHNTWVTVTSDHGELFGEGGWFGHGPIPHKKVLEVPLVEGLAR